MPEEMGEEIIRLGVARPAQMKSPTHIAKRKAEDKSARRLVPRAEECIHRDPRRRGRVRKRETRYIKETTHRRPTPL